MTEKLAPSADIQQPAKAFDHSRSGFAAWAGAYALAIVYASVVVGPGGFNFVARNPETAWRALMETPYVASGSEQRSDWMANLIMLVPLGFLATGALWPRRSRMRQGLAAGTTLGGCMVFVLVVKYLQLFFPPRTVSLNYILAQTLGSAVGVALFWLSRDRLLALRRDLISGDGRPLMIACGAYTLAFFFYVFFPFDFALSADDLRERLAQTPQLLLSWSGTQLPMGLRLILALVDTAATIPLGVLLAGSRNSMSIAKIALAGFLIMSAATGASLLLLDATPSLAGLGYRTVGILIGGVLAKRLADSDPLRWRNLLAQIVPWLIVPYLIVIFYVRDLLSLEWRTVPEALGAFDYLGLLPFYHHYIVTKAHAARSVVTELICFAPIGVMIALRRGSGRASMLITVFIALLLSLGIEFGRWSKPDLQPDFSNAIVAAVGAGLSVKLTAVFWRIVEDWPTEVTGTRKADPGSEGDKASSHSSPEAFPRNPEQARPAATLAGLVVALVCLTVTGWIAADYPLWPGLLGTTLMFYGVALWRWPSLWMAVLPAVLPAYDLAPWTGWTYVGEPDLFALTSIGILVLRAPPRSADFRVGGLPAIALGLTVISCLASVALGLTMPGPTGGSDNPYLRPDNALRVAKGLFVALALLPFLRERLRRCGNAMTWLGTGLAAGLALVAAATVAERLVFTSLFDVVTDYRVVATFSSMHLGGGYIGAYVAMTLPFLLVFMLRPRVPAALAMIAIALGAGYALVVTFARTAYAAAVLATITSCLGWVWATRRRDTGARAAQVLLCVFVGGILAAGLATPYMGQRVRQIFPDLAAREANWETALALRDSSLTTAFLGMGLGTYPRSVLTRKPGDRFPTNFVVAQEGGYRFLSLSAGLPEYFGQKVMIEPDRQYRLFLPLRSRDGKGEVRVVLCNKLLLYSENCRGVTFTPQTIGKWEDFGAEISTAGLRSDTFLPWLRRPVELSLFNPNRGTTIDVGHIRMFDPADRDIIADGDFSRGTERWYFTDDEHLVWHIKNLYLMSLFEGGVLGLASFVLLIGTALAGAARAIGRGEHMAAPVMGALIGFLFSGAFDDLLGVPRLTTLFYLIALCGLTMLKRPPLIDAPTEPMRAETDPNTTADRC